MKTSTIVSISVGTAVTGLVGTSEIRKQRRWRWDDRANNVIAYAVYFDYKRRSDPEFRKALKRESRRQARIAKEEAEIQGKQQREQIKGAVQEAIEEGFPTDIEEKEAYFMQQIAQGEALAGDGSSTSMLICCLPD